MQTETNTNSTAHTIKRVLTIIALIVVVVGIGATVLKLYLSQRYAYQENLNSQLTREKSKLNCYELPLHCAVRDKNLALLNGVARGDALIESLDGWSRSPLYFAITLADKDAIAALLSKGANPNVFNEEGKSALLASIQMKQYEVAKMLLEHGAQVDVEVMAFTENSSLPLYSPLSYCVANNELKCVELLFDHGANIDAKNSHRIIIISGLKNNVSAYEIAMSNSNVSAEIKQLLEDRRNKTLTPIHSGQHLIHK